MGRVQGHYDGDGDALAPGCKKEGAPHRNLFEDHGMAAGNACFIPVDPTAKAQRRAHADTSPDPIVVTETAFVKREEGLFMERACVPTDAPQGATAMARFLRIVEARDQARIGPGHASRWRRRRAAAEKADWVAEELVRINEASLGPAIVDEAAEIVARACPPPQW